MAHPHNQPISFLISLLLLIPAVALAWECETDVFITDQLTLENNYLDSLSGTFNQRDPFNIISVSPSLHISQKNRLHLDLIADLTWTHYWEGDPDANDLDAELINAFATMQTQKITVELGIQSFQLGGGYIMASEEPGIAIHYQPTHTLSAEIKAASIIHTSPIVWAAIDYQFGFLEKIGLFGAWFQDNGNSFADMLAYQDTFLLNRWLYNRNRLLWLLNQNNLLNFTDSRGDLYWYGLRGSVFLGNCFLSGIVIFETGNGDITIEYPSRKWDFTVSSYLVDIDFCYTAADLFSITTFLFVSGGIDSGRGYIDAFIAPMPRNNRTSIFFSPQFSDQIDEDFLSKGGIYWAGVIAPGINVKYHPSESWESGITIAAFFPEDPPADRRDWYGWEADISLSYTWQQRYTVFCELGWFQHGDFYTDQGDTPTPAGMATLGVQTFF